MIRKGPGVEARVSGLICFVYMMRRKGVVRRRRKKDKASHERLIYLTRFYILYQMILRDKRGEVDVLGERAHREMSRSSSDCVDIYFVQASYGQVPAKGETRRLCYLL